jgi:hypothetical protein
MTSKRGVRRGHHDCIRDDLRLNKDTLRGDEEAKEMEAKTRDNGIPLVGVQLGSTVAGKEISDELARARFHATPRILSGCKYSSSQLSLIPLKQGRRSSQSS